MSVLRFVLGGLAALGFGASAHAATFDLSSAIGATPTFSITQGGTTATFTSPAGNGFQVQNTQGLYTFSPALVDNNFFGSDALTISFSSRIYNQITIPFAFFDIAGANLSTDVIGVLTSNGRGLSFASSLPSSQLEPQGVINFVPNSNGLTSLTLTSANAFSIGNVSVPEPMSLPLLGAGLMGLFVSRRRGA